MPNPNKSRGDRFEVEIRDHARPNGFPWCERTRAGYARDHGDLHFVPGPAVIASAKNHATWRFSEWLADLAEQVQAAGAEHGFLVVKRRGVGDPGRSYAVTELDAHLRLVRAAGYGEPLEDPGVSP